ncbi:MAG TPA: ribosome biogenesis GTPase Der, partial [Gammaproteobacteria bacterium]|nr:ribosome biogenesis GTPase Der [Gammaproteobacteria bacterium]
AVEEADVVLLLVDGREGLCAADEAIAGDLRRSGKPVFVAVNKAEGRAADDVNADFYALGLGRPRAIAAAHGRGIRPLMDALLETLPPAEVPEEEEDGIRVAIIGRPNVGKSTLINRILGEERVLVYDHPGTTRDAIRVPFERDDQRYTLVDTAGVRRRARVKETVEKFSVIKTLQAIEAAHVVVMVLDARSGIADQDAHLLGFAMEAGRALVVAVNKWDHLERDQRDTIRRELDVKLPFLSFLRPHFISALHGTGVGEVFDAVRRAYASATADLATPKLTRLLEEAVARHAPPLVRGRRIKLRYAHQGGRNPPLIVVHGTQTESVPDAYRRYLENWFRDQLRLEGTPVRIEFKSGENPYAGRRNTLTRRQQDKRKRLKRFVGRKEKGGKR